MSPTLDQIVRETMQLTGADAPDLLADGAPILSASAIRDGDDDSFYLVGLIGGKEVGKSALVNALAGLPITTSTSFGPGTEAAVAYVHRSRAAQVEALLQSIIPGQYRIVTHAAPELTRQVLVDLPDIDSVYQSHLQVTRAMLRHMLYPLWIASVEKYADRQPRQMLAEVAAGNAPQNFIFCLNKADQVERASPANDPLAELRDDYAQRIVQTLSLASPPRVYVISAPQPLAFDLPELRERLSHQRPGAVVRESRQLAAQQQERSLLTWLGEQNLPAQAARMDHLLEDARQQMSARIAPLLLERVVPALLTDSASASALADEVLEQRIRHWPLVNLVHTLLAPLFLLIRSMVSRNAGSPLSAANLVDNVLRQTGMSLSDQIQSAFGQLRRMQPAVGELYAENKLWESMAADLAAASLAQRLTTALLDQRQVARDQLVRGRVWIVAPLRWALTWGAILWFPFIQPILALALGEKGGLTHWALLAPLLVQVLGVDYLLKSAGFLVIWFAILWLALRWNTQQRVARLRRARGPADASSIDLTRQAMQWMDELLAPIRERADRFHALHSQAEKAGVVATPRQPRLAV